MLKTAQTRLDETIGQIPEWRAELFPGMTVGRMNQLQAYLREKTDLFYDRGELSALLSLGGIRIVRTNEAKTRLRHLKRLTLLFYRVLCYRSAQEARAYKEVIRNLDLEGVKRFAKLAVDMGLRYWDRPNDWANEVTQRNGGRMVVYYRQKEDPRMRPAHCDVADRGWCLGMSVRWLECRSGGANFWTEHPSPEAASRYRFVMAAQRLRQAFADEAEKDLIAERGGDVRMDEIQRARDPYFEDSARFRLERAGLTKVGANTTGLRNPSSEALAQAILASRSAFCLINMGFSLLAGGGGHAVAAHMTGGGVVFFDPNLGELSFASPRAFTAWFPLFTAYQGYKCRSFSLEHYRV